MKNVTFINQGTNETLTLDATTANRLIGMRLLPGQDMVNVRNETFEKAKKMVGNKMRANYLTIVVSQRYSAAKHMKWLLRAKRFGANYTYEFIRLWVIASYGYSNASFKADKLLAGKKP